MPPIAPFKPAPSTPPNSPLPTPNVPHPPLLPSPLPPAIPPQLLPPCPGNQPPPQKLIPNAPSADKAPTRPATCSSSNCSSGGPAADMVEDVPAGSSSSSSSSSSSQAGLLGLFRQQQGLQQRWQQALLHTAFADGAASGLAGQEPPALPLPDSIPLGSFSPFEGDGAVPARPSGGAAGTGWRSSGGRIISGSSSFSGTPSMLAAYAVADTAAAQAADVPAGNIPSVLTADDAGPAVAAPKSSKKALFKGSSGTDAASFSAPQDAATASAKAAAAASSATKAGTGSASSTTNGAVQDLQQQLQGLQDAAQRDPGVSDFLRAAVGFGEAVLRVALIVLRLLVQVTAALLQAAVKLLVWLLDWAGQRAA
ncbi:hypothetical protein COO60DRAFT_1643204 [Scenedesmus sp. NREL 46B-D3]|nr:hypothetical protein COO60DRAFT_1643204 [Scenedesmus sp. NREL 46B-D3]